jgi:maltose alpha-D-glucosyltransferase/alpha-amylase
MTKRENPIDDDPFWYKDAIIYQTHVRAFYDANGDGIGDFKGLTEKLGYLEELGVTAVWLLPFYPSPLKDDGYDTADYHDVHLNYGTLRDFQDFLKEAHRRGIRVITEMVINHTSDQHAWFQRARRAKPGTAARDFYVWNDSSKRYPDARIIFKDFEISNWAWDPVAQGYYWHRFYSHQPDLNFESPEVRKQVLQAVDYWLKMGVDGLRLDAIPYLYEREGTDCENLPETHAFLQKLRAHVDRQFPHRMLLAEANQWPEDAAAYFGKGDECHMAFHFPLMPRMFMAVQMEDRFPIVDILSQTPSIPENAQWAMFLRNHDELTLEMVTDEERDYMYRVYARDPVARINLGIRRRLAPLLENDRRKIELMNLLLFTMPGTPVIYYGDEIGMGDNHYLGDRNGVRTPMQWSSDKNAGFSRANPQKLYFPTIIDPEYHYESVNVENQEHNKASLLWWMKRLIAVRKQSKAFGRGSIEFLYPDNPKILAFLRIYQDEKILVVVNLSRHSQSVELDLSPCTGCVPEEVFGRSRFPAIKDGPYTLTPGGYGYYLFHLQPPGDMMLIQGEGVLSDLGTVQNWESLLETKAKTRLERDILPVYVQGCRWFAGKARTLQQIKIIEEIPVKYDAFPSLVHLIFLECAYTEGLPEVYLLPLSFVPEDRNVEMVKGKPAGAIARLVVGGRSGFLRDGIYEEGFRRTLLAAIGKKMRFKGRFGEIGGHPGPLRRVLQSGELPLNDSLLMKAEQSNTSVTYAGRLYLKLYRRLEEGINPDMEVVRFLSEKAGFPNIPPFAGTLEYRKAGSEPMTLGLLQGCVANQGDAWRYTLDELNRYIERVLVKNSELPEIPDPSVSPLAMAYQDVPLLIQEMIGGVYFEMAVLLGKRTAELHLALSSDAEDPAFAPEPFTALQQRSIYQSMQSQARRGLQILRKRLRHLSPPAAKMAEEVLQNESRIFERLKAVLMEHRTGVRMRIHGDYHLGQVLYTGGDFVIIDFEGEPARPISERRLKRSPLRDIAGMLRSFHYAAYTGMQQHVALRPEDLNKLGHWIELWHRYVGGAFLRSYIERAQDASFLPGDVEETDILLNAFLLHKAIYELVYELNSRPDWVMTPLRGIRSVLDIHKDISLPLLLAMEKAYPSGMANL